MQRAVRNLGRAGLAATAISAVDVALWDLKANCSDLPLAHAARPLPRRGPDLRQRRLHDLLRRPALRDQLAGWVERDGCQWVKMKIGTDPRR